VPLGAVQSVFSGSIRAPVVVLGAYHDLGSVRVVLQPVPLGGVGDVLAVWRGADAWAALRMPVMESVNNSATLRDPTNGTYATNGTIPGTKRVVNTVRGGVGHPSDRPLSMAARAARIESAHGLERNVSIALAATGRVCLDPQAVNYAGMGLEAHLARSDVLRALRTVLSLE